MFKWFNPGSQRSSLTQGNIVSVAIQLYRAQGSALFLNSFLGHLWLLLAMLGVFIGFSLLMVIGGLITALNLNGSANNLTQGWIFLIIIPLSILMAIPVLFYAFGRFHACGGLLARQIFWSLRQQTETPEDARSAVYPRWWVFGLSLLLAFLLTVVFHVLLVPFGYASYWIWDNVLWQPIQTIEINSPWGMTLRIVAGFIFALGVLALLLVSYLFTLRLSFTDVVLATEPPMNAWQAVVRSWQLTEWKYILHIATVLFICSLIVGAGSWLAGIVNTITFVPVAGFMFGVLVFPCWQGTKALLYYDLRCRKEGLNFDLATSIPSPRGYLQRVTIQTPESIELDFALAGVGSRSFAWLIDQVLLWLGLVLLTLLGGYLYAFAILPSLETIWDTDRINQWAAGISLVLFFFLSNGYSIIFETLWQGQTPGKRIAQIRVVRDNGQPIRMMEAALRSLIKPIDLGLLFVGVLLIIFTKSEKRLGDMAAGTLVIQDEAVKTTANPQMEISDASKGLARQLLTNPYLSKISPDQYLTLRDFLTQRQQLGPKVRLQTATKLTDQLRVVVLPQEPVLPDQLSEEAFLQAVYLAYRRHHRSPGDAAGQNGLNNSASEEDDEF